MAEIDRVICVKNEIFVYQVPPRASNRGYRAADWKLDQPDWVGRMRIVSRTGLCLIKLEDRNSGDLFASCPVDNYPGSAVEQVLDSSRYFVIRIKDDSGRSANIGIGFSDRGDSFDMLVALQDHFKWEKREEKEEATPLDSGPKLDLRFKEGQTIKINLKTKKTNDEDDDDESPAGPTIRGRTRPAGGGGGGLLPPPPAAGSVVKINPPGRGPTGLGGFPPAPQTQIRSPPQSTAPDSNINLLADFGAPSQSSPNTDPWANQSNSGSGNQSTQSNSGWVQF